jgi:hypothetical protein
MAADTRAQLRTSRFDERFRLGAARKCHRIYRGHCRKVDVVLQTGSLKRIPPGGAMTFRAIFAIS